MLLTEYDEIATTEAHREECREELCIELYQEGSITAECAAKKLNITVEEFKELIDESNS